MPMADCISKSDMTETTGMIHPEGNFLSSLWNQISDALPKYSASKTQWWDRNRIGIVISEGRNQKEERDNMSEVSQKPSNENAIRS